MELISLSQLAKPDQGDPFSDGASGASWMGSNEVLPHVG